MKPDNSGEENLYIINQNNANLVGELWLEAVGVLAWMIEIDSRTFPSRSAAFNIAASSYLKVTVRLASEGLAASDYPVKIVVSAKTTSSLRVTSTQDAVFTVVAPAHPNTTTVSMSGRPTLGEVFKGIKITARDSDGIRVEADQGDDFEVILMKSSKETILIPCAVEWDSHDKVYGSICELPASIDDAGMWDAEIKLSGKVFAERRFRTMCRSGYYESKTQMCERCPAGTDCSEAGETLRSLPILPGHWRSGVTSSDVRECLLGKKACGGSASLLLLNTTVDGTAGFTNGSYCRTGYDGPLCGTCASEFFRNWAEASCDTCASLGSQESMVVPLILLIVGIGGLVLKRVYKSKTSKAPDESDLSPVRIVKLGVMQFKRQESKLRRLQHEISERAVTISSYMPLPSLDSCKRSYQVCNNKIAIVIYSEWMCCRV